MSTITTDFSNPYTAVYLVDADTLRCEYANSAGQRDLQYSMIELRELMPRRDAPGFSSESMLPLLISLKRDERQEVAGEASFRRKDGTVFPVAVRLALWQGAGKPLLAIVARDLASSENKEEMQKDGQGSGQGAGQAGDGETRSRTIVSNAPGIVFQYVLGEDGSHSLPFVSDQCVNLLGMTVETLQENPPLLLTLVLPEDQNSLRQSRAASAASLTTWNWEGRLWIKSYHDVKWVSLRASPRREEGIGVIWEGIIINVTQSRRREIELEESHERLKEVSSHIMAAREHERIRIAREIHDDLGGNLTAIKIDLDWIARRVDDGNFSEIKESPALLAKVLTVSQMVDRTMQSIQRISRDLRPGIMDFGIVAAIEWEAGEFAKRLGIPCELSCARQDIDLEPDVAVAVFRIFQESLTNITKHAQASRVWVRLGTIPALDQEWLELEVRDNGFGIMPSDLVKLNSFGIRGMVERASFLGGKLTVNRTREIGTAGQGTIVRLSIPLQSDQGDSSVAAARPSFTA
jgi:two-component system sensor histidine kinase UhpB